MELKRVKRTQASMAVGELGVQECGKVTKVLVSKFSFQIQPTAVQISNGTAHHLHHHAKNPWNDATMAIIMAAGYRWGLIINRVLRNKARARARARARASAKNLIFWSHVKKRPLAQ